MCRILLIAFFPIFLLGCFTDNDEIVHKKYKHVNDAAKISLVFPAHWIFNFKSSTFDIIALDPTDSVLHPNTYPSVSVLIGSHAGITDLNQILLTEYLGSKSNNPSLDNYQDTIKVLNGKQYAEMSYTRITSLKDSLKTTHVYILNNNTDAAITFTDFTSRFDSNQDLKDIYMSMEIN